MKLSYNWLKEYVDLSDITPEELADKHDDSRSGSRRSNQWHRQAASALVK
jgi:hypothetical protein